MVIDIVQGTDKEIYLDFGESDSIVKSVIFTGNYCGLCKTITEKIDNSWLIYLSREETALLPNGITTFDIDIITTNNRKIPAVYKGELKIKKKEA